MKIAAIIAEYNPFHTGHAYQIEMTKKLTGADHVIAIMSGDYVQRGAPAIMDKYERTRLALMGGIDLVIELPMRYATASSIDFAKGAIRILEGLHCVDYLCFGSEEGNLTELSLAARLFLHETDNFKKSLKDGLSKGFSYPRARKLAYEKETGKCAEFLDAPNNNLAISYLMALMEINSSINPVTVKRLGDYNSTATESTFASASALRYCLEHSFSYPVKIDPYLTDQAFMKERFKKSYPITSEDFYPYLSGKLCFEESYSDYLDLSPELSNRLKKNYLSAPSFDELSVSLKTSVYTKTRIDRALLHFMLDLKENEADAIYARILGFKRGNNLLKFITARAGIPILTKALPDTLPESLLAGYKKQVKACNLYESIKCRKFADTSIKHEYSKKLIVL